jgi:hypothetical protein
MTPLSRFLVLVVLLLAGCPIAYGQSHDVVRIDYPDSLKVVGLKFDVGSILSNHLMAGFEVPLKNNQFFEFNMGISGLFKEDNYYEEAEIVHRGVVLRTGFKIPVIYTTALSMCYLMPEYAFSGFRVDGYDYNTSTRKEYAIRSNALLLNFGFRHVNPRSGFFYDIGIGYGVGFTNHGAYGGYAYTFFINNSSYYTSPDSSFSGLASTYRGSIGWVLKQKK